MSGRSRCPAARPSARRWPAPWSATPALLLDEPFSALDTLTRISMHGLVLSLWKRYRPAVLLVTHDVDEALALADRVLVLAHGKIAHSADITLDRPRDRDHPDLVALASVCSPNWAWLPATWTETRDKGQGTTHLTTPRPKGPAF